MTDEARFKNFFLANLGPSGLNQALNKVFCHFLKFSSLVFLEISYNDSLQQCLTPSGGKTHEKKLGVQIWAKRAKIGPEISFL